MKPEELKEFLSSTGKISSMRWAFLWSNRISWLLACLSIIGSVAIGIYASIKNKSLTDIAPYVSALLIGTAGIIGSILATANAGKSIQAHAEKKRSLDDGNINA
jgi:hypothetical protein